MEEALHKQSLDRSEVIARLSGRGITPTHQRVEIAQLLFARPQHVSAEQVLAMVNHGLSSVSKATVYNTLNLFAREGLIREVIVDPTKVFYDSNTRAHHHFYNVDNGTLTDVPTGQLQLQGMPAAPAGMETLGVDIIIRVRNVQV